MRFSWDWLAELLPAAAVRQDVARLLTRVGMHVEIEEAHGGDVVWDVDVTSNRPDAMCHAGMAREAAAALGAELRAPRSFALREAAETTAAAARLSIEAPGLCPRYVARIVRGVRVGPSPAWLAERLTAIGVRPVNNVVDATNYVLHESGQPLHAFDLARLAGHEIRVRLAAPGEWLETLDGKNRELAPDMLVIADRDRAVALAGVMGGASSEIRAETRDVLLESAYFTPSSVRRTARRLGLHTDASHRFERGCDPLAPPAAAERAAALIAELAGGEVLAGAIDANPVSFAARQVGLRWRRLSALAGTEIPAARALAVLQQLGFRLVAGTGAAEEAVFEVPSWRVDIELEEDLVEEVLRFHGYDAIPARLPAWSHEPVIQLPELGRERTARDYLASRGLAEAVTYAFVGHEINALFAGAGEGAEGERPLPLANPLAETQGEMRTSLVGGLAETVAHNLRRGAREIALFEIGRRYARAPKGDGDGDGSVRERRGAAWALAGQAQRGWDAAPRPVDFFDAKGLLEGLAAELGLPPLEFVPAHHSWLAPGVQADALAAGVRVASVGALSRRVLEHLGLASGMVVAEIDFPALPAAADPPRYRPVPRFPGIVMDLTVVHEPALAAGRMLGVLRQRGGEELREARLKYRYRDDRQSPPRVKSTFELLYQRLDRSLTHEEVNQIHGVLVAAMRSELGVEQG